MMRHTDPISQPPSLSFGRDIVSDLEAAARREWLVTNGIGGFASGTVAGLNTRRYHGLLIAALQPPLGRTLVLARLEEEAVYNGQPYPLSTNEWASGTVSPQGYKLLQSFHLEGTVPVFTYALLEKRLNDHGRGSISEIFDGDPPHTPRGCIAQA